MDDDCGEWVGSMGVVCRAGVASHSPHTAVNARTLS